MSLHLGHSISMSSSGSTGSSFCSCGLDSSITSRTGFSGFIFGGTSLVRLCFDIVIINKIDYYIPADYKDRGRSPHSPSISSCGEY